MTKPDVGIRFWDGQFVSFPGCKMIQSGTDEYLRVIEEDGKTVRAEILMKGIKELVEVPA